MPRRREPASLASACLQNIAHNMQSIWVKDYAENYMEKYNFLYVEGPFNQLAGAMVQELLRILGESHRLTRAGLHLLLQPHLTELSLRSCAGLVSNAITQLVTVRCQFLWSLDLHSCQRVPAPTLAVLLEGLPRLVKLCLSDTQCDTRVLSAVGSCCPRLRELDISHCKKLTPPSLLHLAYDPTRGTFCCQALRVLLAQDVMQPGPPEQWVHALCFLLLALPSLEQLSNASLPSALRLLCTHLLSEGGSSPSGFPQLAEVARAKISLAKVGKEPADGYRCQSKLGMGPAVEGGCRKEEGGTHQAEDGEGKAGRALRLRRLEDMEEVDLPLVGSLCQGVEEAAISLGDQVGPSLGIVQWPRLTHLTLHCPGPPVRSLEEVLTSLESTGSRLRFLSLQNLLWGQEGSLRTLLSLCPNLRTFQSHLTPRCRSVPRHAPEAELPPWGEELVPLPLPHLRSFSLLMDGGDPMHPVFEHTLGGSLVSLLCGCPKLETVSMWGVSVLLDRVFEATLVFSPPPLRRLRAASLCRSNVTPWGASLLLGSDNQLETLDLSHCPDITCRDHQRLQKRVGKEGMVVDITWQ